MKKNREDILMLFYFDILNFDELMILIYYFGARMYVGSYVLISNIMKFDN